MSSSDAGITSFSSFSVFEKASPKSFTVPSGMVYVPVFPSGHFIKVVISLSKSTPSAVLKFLFSGFAIISVRLSQSKKAFFSIVVTLLGTVILRNCSHLQNILIERVLSFVPYSKSSLT